MKVFHYFEHYESGMHDFEVLSEDDLHGLFQWRNGACLSKDNQLLAWMQNADVGEKYDHRCGVMVRLKDK